MSTISPAPSTGSGTPASTVTDETTFGVAKAVGTATAYAREDHTHGSEPHEAIDAAAATGSMRTLGTGAQQAAAGTDSRFTDARTPTAHEATHELGGTDPVPTPLAPTTTVTIPSAHCAVVAGRYYITVNAKLIIADTARFAIV